MMNEIKITVAYLLMDPCAHLLYNRLFVQKPSRWDRVQSSISSLRAIDENLEGLSYN
jgi:hypothetical protein